LEAVAPTQELRGEGGSWEKQLYSTNRERREASR
jgi:hypothetical protein